MAQDIVIRAEGLGKKYVIGHQAEGRETLRDAISRTGRNLARSALDLLSGRPMVAGDALEEFWALRGLDFEVARGEVVGIIGRNGAGKSTLLKILSRITEPTEGRVSIKGRVASLLEVGTGFHPELSGRENIFLNGGILGMSRAEIRRKFDAIVDFAEVDRFLDTPVKRYSSGMYVRLAFAVAAHLEPEILVVDEVLAVGDQQFQQKCLGKMQDVASQGRTVLFVSHQLGSVARLCGKCMLMRAGGLQSVGPTQDVIALYNSAAVQGDGEFRFDPPAAGARVTPIVAYAHRGDGAPETMFDSNQAIHVAIRYRAEAGAGAARIGFRLSTPDGQVLLTTGTSDLADSDPLGAGEATIGCAIPANLLAPGQYLLSFAGDIPFQEVLFEAENVLALTITEQGAIGAAVPDGRLGVLRPALTWKRHERQVVH